MIDKNKNPLSDDLFPPLASAHEKLALVLQACKPTGGKTFDCEMRDWCLLCNSKAILTVCAKKHLFTIDDLREGRFKFCAEIKEVIHTLKPGEIGCTMHPKAAKYHGAPYSSGQYENRAANHE